MPIWRNGQFGCYDCARSIGNCCDQDIIVTYGQRYLIKMIFNIAVGEDDDGNRAGAGPLLSTDQVAELQALIEDVGANKALFLEWLGVGSLSEIPVKRYAQAIKALNDKRRGK